MKSNNQTSMVKRLDTIIKDFSFKHKDKLSGLNKLREDIYGPLIIWTVEFLNEFERELEKHDKKS